MNPPHVVPNSKELAETAWEYFPNTFPLDYSDMFTQRAPVEVDLGSGSGKFLVGAAAQFPDRNFVGIERLLGRVRKTRRKASVLNLPNLRVVRSDLGYALEKLIPPGSVCRFHLSFPDPWPKRRHFNRRLVDSDFFPKICRLLDADGEIWIQTDHDEYFSCIRRAAAHGAELFSLLEWSNDYPPTDFEADYVDRKIPIHRLRLRKTR